MSKFKKTLATLFFSILAQTTHAEVTVGNSQFVSKLYTEALGRMPDQSGWNYYMSALTNNACTLSTLQSLATGILTASEFHIGSPTNREKVFNLYRTVYQRDAYPAEFTNTLSLLDGGTPWTTVVANLLNTYEFTSSVSSHCGSAPTGWKGLNVPYNTMVNNSAQNVRDEYALRQALQTAAPGTTVYLEQGATIPLSSKLDIPPGVTLATYGLPAPSRSALLGRLYRNFSATFWDGVLIDLSENSTIRNIWVDGQRNRYGYLAGAISVYANASNAKVKYNRITDTAAWTSIYYAPYGSQCVGGEVSDNLVTSYGSTHYIAEQFTDGISIACSSVAVDRNQVVDATDVSIIVYRGITGPQTSKVRDNSILNAGNSAYGGIMADTFYRKLDAPPTEPPLSEIQDFTGTEFNNNLIWTSPNVHIDIAIVNGARPWFGPTAYTGKGARFFQNNSGSSTVTTGVGISTSGMLATVVQSNALMMAAMPVAMQTCGHRTVAVAPSPYGNDSLSSIQPHTVLQSNDVLVTGCIGHPPGSY